MKPKKFNRLVKEVLQCTLCVEHLALGARPVLQVSQKAKILIAGQAPGIRVHNSGVPFDDASGKRLRNWLGVTKETFYNSNQIAILPMGFCYPGTGSSGDLPPRPECAHKWRSQLLNAMPQIELSLVLGMYAKKWHMPELKNQTLTQTVRDWELYWPHLLPLPHPSPRNNSWLKKNPWFEQDLIPNLQNKIQSLLNY